MNNYFIQFYLRGQLPPDSTARSTIIEPCAIELTISSVIKTGAGFPGINAVEITISCFDNSLSY